MTSVVDFSNTPFGSLYDQLFSIETIFGISNFWNNHHQVLLIIRIQSIYPAYVYIARWQNVAKQKQICCSTTSDQHTVFKDTVICYKPDIRLYVGNFPYNSL